MTALFCDSMDGFTDDAGINSFYWTFQGLQVAPQTTGGFNGKGSLRVIRNNITDLQALFSSAAGNTLHISCLIKFGSVIPVGRFLAVGTGTTDNTNLDFLINANGQIEIQAWNGTSVIVTETANPGYFSNKDDIYVHFEAEIKLDNAAGIVKVWLDGDLAIDFLGDTIATGTPGAWTGASFLCPAGASQQCDYDDVLIWDNTGSGFTSSPLGAGTHFPLMESFRPTGAGAITNFTPSAGSNFQNVDDANEDGNVTTNFSSTSGHIDLFTHAAPVLDNSDIQAVAVRNSCKIDTTTYQFRDLIRHGGTNAESANFAVGHANYRPKLHLFFTNPSTAAAWLESELASMEFGYKVETAAAGRLDVTHSIAESISLEAFTATIIEGDLAAIDSPDIGAFNGTVPLVGRRRRATVIVQ